MTDAVAPLVAVVGFKRSRLAMAGGVRVLVVRDGKVRMLGKKGRVDVDVAIGDLTARLTKTRTVALRYPEGSSVIYGITDITRIAKELQEIAARESDGAELIGPAPGGFLGFMTPRDVTGPAKISRALAEGLHERGAGEP